MNLKVCLTRISGGIRRHEGRRGVALLIVILLLIFAFLIASAAVTFVYSSNLTSAVKEHRMISLDRAETALNTAMRGLNTMKAVLPCETALPEGPTHTEYVRELESYGPEYYYEADGFKCFLTGDDYIVGMGEQVDYERIIRCKYHPYYLPNDRAPSAFHMDAAKVDSCHGGNAFTIDGTTILPPAGPSRRAMTSMGSSLHLIPHRTASRPGSPRISRSASRASGLRPALPPTPRFRLTLTPIRRNWMRLRISTTRPASSSPARNTPWAARTTR